MLRHRLLSALVIIAGSLLFVGLDALVTVGQCAGLWMVPLGMALVLGSALECVWMTRDTRYGSIVWPAMLGCGGVIIAAAVPVYWPLFGSPYPSDCLLGPLGWPLAAAAIALIGCFVWQLPNYQSGQGILLRAILAGWVSVYFGICFAFAVALRLDGTPTWGLYLVVGIVVIAKFADAGAYFSGRSFGRFKLCEHVSPGKTLEGLAGGMLTAVLVGWIYFSWLAPWVFGADNVSVGLLGVCLLGILVTLAGVTGDLLESVFKREMGHKDSGHSLPGLGGLWDVTDSLLPAFVVGYLVVVADLIRGPQ